MKDLGRIVIVDFSKLLPGPFCTMLLADLGCRVIRVELPHWQDSARGIPPKIDGHGFCYWMANRNKESVSLDFRKPEGRRALDRLLAKADVVVEGFRPGLMTRLGLGYRELSRRFPGLVYCSITGYGQDGPLSGRAGHDINFMAQSGFLGLGDSNGSLSFPPVQVGDLSGSMYAAVAILAALLGRGGSGKGRHIDIACAETMLSWEIMAMGQYLATGSVPALRGDWWSGNHAFYRLYKTRDGAHLAVGALERPIAVNLLTALGRPELAESLGPSMERVPASVAAELESVFAGKTSAEWQALLDGKDVCVTPVYGLGEALRHPFFQARGTLKGKHLASPMRLSGKRLAVRRPAPALGQDNARVLRWAGCKPADIRRLRKNGLLPG